MNLIRSVLAALFLAIVAAAPLFAVDRVPAEVDGKADAFIPGPAIRSWYVNPDGSCVQLSIGMSGVHHNEPNAATVPFHTEYGIAVRGGSGPSRVAAYAQRRNMKIWNITGAPTWEWMRWVGTTGRWCAIGAGGNHFQTLVGYDPKAGNWYVCNNNSLKRVDVYSEAEFRRLHLASGQWCVVLQAAPPPPPPLYLKWW